MALKKSELHSSLWQSCDELRGGIDASQYKDGKLVLRSMKYVSDKCGDPPFPPIADPHGSGPSVMVAQARGVQQLHSRAALAGYMLRRWSIDCSPDHSLDPASHHLWLRNPQTLYGVERAVFAPDAKEGGSHGPL